MTGSTLRAQTASPCSTAKAIPSVATSRISSTCGTPALKRMKRSALVQTRGRGKRVRTLVTLKMALCIALMMLAGQQGTQSSFASRLHLKEECNHESEYKDCIHSFDRHERGGLRKRANN